MTAHRILVAGATGQIARSLVEAAAAFEIELVALGRPDLDIEDSAAVVRAVRSMAPTAIVNAAAYTAVDAAESDETAAQGVNRDGPANLARAAEEHDIPFIHISTDYVFDGGKAGAYIETDNPNPQSVYGRSKLAGEVAAQGACRKTIIVRTAWVFSPFGKNFLKTMLALGATRDTLNVVADQHGNPTYAPDVANGILRILGRIQTSGWVDEYAGVYHLAGSGPTTWHGFACHIFDVAANYGKRSPEINAITTAEFPTPARRPQNSRLDCGKIGRTFDIVMPDWRDSTAHCLARLLGSEEQHRK